MREIKFRAWDKTGQIMFVPIGYSYIDGYLTCISEAKRTMQNDVTEHLDETWYEDYREPRYSDGKSEIILMQYTGLKDKNGTPIFENDIVEHYGEVFEVVFDEGAFLINGISTRINPDGSEYVVRGDLLMNQDDVLVVIGNRWENPDLLPANKEG